MHWEKCCCDILYLKRVSRKIWFSFTLEKIMKWYFTNGVKEQFFLKREGMKNIC